ncbi:MAG: hypothetical protein LBU11_08255, partial [Zoogloeaceae bacterium]|nr:hypothetical protein [Zoogloeaceae bacterium]
MWQKAKPYFSPVRSAGKTRQNPAFPGVKATKLRVGRIGFSLDFHGLKASFACFQTQTFPAKVGFYFWTINPKFLSPLLSTPDNLIGQSEKEWISGFAGEELPDDVAHEGAPSYC